MSDPFVNICLCPGAVLEEKGCQCDDEPAPVCDLENPESCESCT